MVNATNMSLADPAAADGSVSNIKRDSKAVADDEASEMSSPPVKCTVCTEDRGYGPLSDEEAAAVQGTLDWLAARAAAKKEAVANKELAAAEPTIEKAVDCVLIVRASYLEKPVLGAETVYTGPSQTVLNGMSSMRTSNATILQLIPGTRVRVCSRPTIPFGTAESSVRIHFSIHVNGHASDCVCGACGCAFDLVNAAAPDLCSCGTDVYDEGEQKCTIM